MVLDRRTGGVIVSTEGDPFLRGQSYGLGCDETVHRNLDSYLGLFLACTGRDESEVRRCGEQVLTGVQAWRPDVARELEGVACGAGLDVELVAALNARTELLSAAECSLLSLHTASASWLAQTWDWALDVPDRTVVWDARTEGHRFVTFTEAGMLAKIGVNDAGLAVGLNVLSDPADVSPRAGCVPIHLLLRELLGTCGCLADVQEVLSEAPVSASSCITVVTPRAAPTFFELSPERMHVLRGRVGVVAAHTNHFLGDAPTDPDPATAESRSRLARLNTGVSGLASARRRLAEHDGICRHAEEQPGALPDHGTVAGVVVDCNDRRLEWSSGPPCGGVWASHRIG